MGRSGSMRSRGILFLVAEQPCCSLAGKKVARKFSSRVHSRHLNKSTGARNPAKYIGAEEEAGRPRGQCARLRIDRTGQVRVLNML